jgi:hypothetical protein
VHLDFGAAAFQGAPRYLDIALRCGDDTDFSSFGERVALTTVPISLHALGAPWAGLTGVPADLADGDNDTTYSAGAGLTLDGTTFAIDSAALAGQFWQTGGNAGTSITTLGTTDGMELTLIVNSTPALRLLPTTDFPTLVGGSGENLAGPAALGSVIGGGGPAAHAARAGAERRSTARTHCRHQRRRRPR